MKWTIQSIHAEPVIFWLLLLQKFQSQLGLSDTFHEWSFVFTFIKYS